MNKLVLTQLANTYFADLKCSYHDKSINLVITKDIDNLNKRVEEIKSILQVEVINNI